MFGQQSSAFGQAAQKPTSSLFGPSTSIANPFASLTANAGAGQPPPTGGSTQPQQQGGGLFGAPSQPQQGGSIFGAPSQQQQGGGLFGSSSQPQQGGGLFGSTSQQQQGGGLFGALSQPQQGGSLFGNTTQSQQSGGIFGASSQPQQSISIFGNPGGNSQQSQPSGSGLFGALPQPQQGGGLFGSTTQSDPKQQQTSNIFGNLGQNSQQQQQPQQASSLFGGLGGNVQQQPQQGGSSLFGNTGANTTQQPQQQGGGLFGAMSQSTQQQQIAQQQGSQLGQSQPRIWSQSDVAPRQKSVTDQIELVFAKWNPKSPTSLFHTYLYNSVSPDQAPFYRPGPTDDEIKWEEALRKRPNVGAIPVLVRGFEELGHRIVQQHSYLVLLQGRLHEINNGLSNLLRTHDLQISTRTDECRRRHLNLSQKCLALAVKVQVLRNRGYAMDSAEEELRKKLLSLEKNVLDPAVNGRADEIWARMVSVRERGRQLQHELDKAGRSLSSDQGQKIDDDVMKRAQKILEDYSSQLSHLTKEMTQIQKDYTEWEQAKPL